MNTAHAKETTVCGMVGWGRGSGLSVVQAEWGWSTVGGVECSKCRATTTGIHTIEDLVELSWGRVHDEVRGDLDLRSSTRVSALARFGCVVPVWKGGRRWVSGG
jgi:hypothetical protein